MDIRDVDPHQEYVIQGHHILALRKMATRLYTENRLSGDEMRDMAQLIVEGIIPRIQGPLQDH